MTPPLTPAGQALLRAQDDGTWTDLSLGEPIAAIERQAADRALAELRREVEGLRSYFDTMEREAESYATENVLALIDKASKP